jgi:hypothetical protein
MVSLSRQKRRGDRIGCQTCTAVCFAQQVSQSICTAGIMRKGCEITVRCSSIFLLYWVVNYAGVMILKILLKYLIMALIIQDLFQKTRHCGK